MFKIDEEILNDLVKTNNSIMQELSNLVKSLNQDPNQKELYEKFGQQIDRIYGTISTLGMNNFAEYTMMLKKIGYACSQYDEKKGRSRTINLMENALANLKVFNEFLNNPRDLEKAKTFKTIVDREKDKAKNLLETVYKNISRTSTDK